MTGAEKMSGAEALAAPPAAANQGCILCGSRESRVRFPTTDRLYRTTRKTFDIVECLRCALLRLAPQPTAAEFDQYYPANYWFDPSESAAGRLEETYRRLVLRDHVRFVVRALQQIRQGEPVLDIGCGGGLFPGVLRQRGFRALGLDVSAEAARLAAKLHGVPVIAGELTHSPVAARSCAAVTMFHVLEHVPNPQQYLAEAGALLRAGGRLILQVPNAACWQFALLGRLWNGVDAPRHLHLFRPADLEKLLESSGFQVVRRKYFSMRDNPAGLATSIAPSLDPMARRIRGTRESGVKRVMKDLLYLSLVVAALPFTLLEAWANAGSTVMIEARKRAS